MAAAAGAGLMQAGGESLYFQFLRGGTYKRMWAACGAVKRRGETASRLHHAQHRNSTSQFGHMQQVTLRIPAHLPLIHPYCTSMAP